MTPAALIDALGGTASVADRLCVTAQAVSNWRQRGTIPARHHLPIATLALAAGVAWQPPGLKDLVLTQRQVPAPPEAPPA